MKKLIYLLLFVSVLSCKKKDDEPTPTPVTPPTVPSGGFGQLNDGENYGGTYLPIVKGYQWCYTGDQSYCAKVTGRTKQIDGLTYIEFEQYKTSSPNDKAYSYYHHKDGVHNAQLISGNIKYNYFTILKENAAENETWEVSFNTTSYSKAVYKFTMIGQVGPVTVDGITYNDVIEVDMETYYAYLFDNEEYLTAIQYSYYAKDVGMIKQTGTAFGLNVELDSKSF